MREQHQRVGEIRLEIVSEAPRERRCEAREIGLAVALEPLNLGELRIGARQRRVDLIAGRRVQEHVQIELIAHVVRVPVGHVGFHRHDVAELLLEAHDALPGVRHLVVVRDDARVLRRQRVLAVDEVLTGLAARRVVDEAGQPIVGERVDENADAVERLLTERRVRVGDVVVEAGAAADDEVALVGDVVGEADARRDVVVILQAGLIERPAGRDAGGADWRDTRRVERRGLRHKRRIDGAEIVVPADAAVDRQAVVQLPRVADPQGKRRPRDVDRPVAEILIEALHRGVEPRQIPFGRIVPRVGGEAAIEIGRRRVEDELAARQQLPLTRIVPAHELAADLEVVLALVDGEIVPPRERVLKKFLRVVARLPDGQVRKHVVGRALERRHGQQVLPVEVAVAELELAERIAVEDTRPRAGGVARLPRAVRRLRRMRRAGDAGERRAPVPVRRAHREMILG